MSDWQGGDLAVCVNAGPMVNEFGFRTDASRKLAEGRAYHVRAIANLGGLLLVDVIAPREHDGWGFLPDRFRKVTPDKREACEEEFVTLLKRSKRKVNA